MKNNDKNRLVGKINFLNSLSKSDQGKMTPSCGNLAKFREAPVKCSHSADHNEYVEHAVDRYT